MTNNLKEKHMPSSKYLQCPLALACLLHPLRPVLCVCQLQTMESKFILFEELVAGEHK